LIERYRGVLTGLGVNWFIPVLSDEEVADIEKISNMEEFFIAVADDESKFDLSSIVEDFRRRNRHESIINLLA